jgi:8-oxo-dGTP pyrophosphatase MutT (NUDIX family)
MWDRAWSTSLRNQGEFFRLKAKFETAFIRTDSGCRLRKMLNESSSSREQWEIPKGRKEKLENQLGCAIREFEEETGIPKSKYKLILHKDVKNDHLNNVLNNKTDKLSINNKHLTYSYHITDEGQSYTFVYYLGILHFDQPTNIYKSKLNDEIIEQKWMTLEQIKIMHSERLYDFVKNIANDVRAL